MPLEVHTDVPGAVAGQPVGLHVGRAVRKRLGAGILVFLLAAPAAVGLAILQFQPEYRAKAAIQVNPMRPRILYRTDENTPSQSYSTFFNTQLAFLRRDEVLGRCLSDPAVSSSGLFDGRQDDRLVTLRKAVRAEGVPGTQLIEVSVTAHRPQGLGAVVNVIIREYLNFLGQTDSVSQNRRHQLLDDERKKLQVDVETKTAALAQARARIAGDPNAGSGNPLRDPLSIRHQALVDAQTKQSSLKSKVDSLRSLLKGSDIPVPDRLVDESLDRDPEVQYLTAMTGQIRRELLKAEAEAASPPGATVQARVAADPRVATLKQEILRGELYLAWLTQAPPKGAAPGSADPPSFLMPSGLATAALGQNTEAQRLAALSLQLRQELAALQAPPANPTPAAVRQRLDAEPTISALRAELAQRETLSAVQSQTLEKEHHTVTNTNAALKGLSARLAEREGALKGKITEEIKKEMKQNAEQRAAEIRAQLQEVEKQLRPQRERDAKDMKALLDGLRERLATTEPEVTSKAAEELKKEAARRAEDLRAQLKSVEKQAREYREAARSRIAARLKDEGLSNVRRQIDESESELRGWASSEKGLKADLAKQADAGTAAERRAADAKQMEDELRLAQGSLQGVEQRLHELDVEAGAPGYITEGSRATDPTAPEAYLERRVKYCIVGVLGALGLALLVMILLERRDDRIWSADDLQGPVGTELLGCVPHWSGLYESAGGPALLCHSAAQVPALVAEEMRNLMAGVLYPADGRPAKTVLVTGAAPGDGNTTLAANLAACIASLGKNVLLVDANFRKADVARVFHLGNIPGLGDILAYGADPVTVIRPTDISGLSVLTAGTAPPSSVDLLGSTAMHDHLERFRSEFDYVFIDGPPLILADARVVAPLVDGVICAFRALASRRAAVHDSLATLRRLGARTIGVALMGVHMKHNGHAFAAKAISAYAQLEHAPEPPAEA